MAILFVSVNLFLYYYSQGAMGREYRIQINRMESSIKENGITHVDRSLFPDITGVSVLGEDGDEGEKALFFSKGNDDYAIRYIDGKYYRFDYRDLVQGTGKGIIIAVNIIMTVMSLLLLALLAFIQIRILAPFHQITDLPYELSKGNLTVGIREGKNRYFARFIWGINMLREKLEDQKDRELNLQKERKRLILSLSHDIKTPLSAIKLYARALSGNLYGAGGENDGQAQIAEKINQNADKIEGFVSDIIKASKEDFMEFPVINGEFYLSNLLQEIEVYYKEKLSLLKIDFHVERAADCLLRGDMDRSVEILQNIMENAIKYGDGECITITVGSEEDCKLITVSNTGCTLPIEELPHIFESFWRGSNAGSIGGNGLGLFICRQLIRKMEGDIYAAAENRKMKLTVVFRMI